MKWYLKLAVRMAIGLILYIVMLLALGYWFPEKSPRHWLVLVPVTMMVIYFAAMLFCAMREMDEMWRKNFTEAMAFSGIATGFSCFGYKFFREIIGAPEFHAEWAFLMMWAYVLIYPVAITIVSWWRRK